MAIDNRISIKNRFSKISTPYGFIPPKKDYLVGWYRYDEGSGLIVKNYGINGDSGGGLFPNLDVKNNDGMFWSGKTGFGSTLTTNPANKVSFAIGNPNKYLGTAGNNTHAFGVFLYKYAPFTDPGYSLSTKLINDSSGSYGWRILLRKNGYNESKFIWTSIAYPNFDTTNLFNNWSFWFTSLPQTCLVKSNGTILIQTGINRGSTSFHYIHLGIGYDGFADTGYYAAKVSYADWIIYNNINLTISDWSLWYDYLRPRFSMSARSGW